MIHCDCHDTGRELYLITKVVALSMMALAALSILISWSACTDLYKSPANYDSEGVKTSVICATMLILSHVVVSIVNFCNGVRLFRLLRESNFLKFYQWYLNLLPILSIECLIVFIFLFFKHNVLYFSMFGNMCVTLKLYMLWPIKRFLKYLRNNRYAVVRAIWTRSCKQQ